MALVKCEECGNQVSTKATNCPQCGAKIPRKTSATRFLIIIAILIAAYSTTQMLGTTPSSSSAVSSAEPASEVEDSTIQTPPTPTWQSSTSRDEMTGETKAYAVSVNTSSTKRMDTPYSNVQAWMGVGCDSSSEWAYFGFNVSPNITNDDIRDGFNVINTRIKWDDSIEDTRLIQQWGAKAIHFSDDEAVAKIINSSSAMLELDWYGQGAVNFQFPLEDSSTAIEEMRENCK